MSDVEVAIIGAGPYGLSLAAHLSAASMSYRHFGVPMRLWRGAMPKGMFLKSQGFASNLSDPRGTHTLEAFCQATRHPYQGYGLPVSLENFVNYGQWFQSELDLKVEELLVTGMVQRADGFELTLADGEQFVARRVVVAIGVEHFAYVPQPLSELPASACTHSSAHTDLTAFRGREVVVVGAGQSALESAALLHENGATVQVLARKQAIAWNGVPLDPDRPLLRRLREPEAGLGSGWSTWFYSSHPELFRCLPERTRVYRARTALGPAGASWLRERVEGQFPVRTGQTVSWAKPHDGKVRLGISGPGTADSELAADHVIAATGYRVNVKRLEFLPATTRSSLRTVGGSAAVGRDYQSSIPGLYFIGPSVAPSMGPVMRFVYGSKHAATTVGRHLAAVSGRESALAMAAGRLWPATMSGLWRSRGSARGDGAGSMDPHAPLPSALIPPGPAGGPGRRSGCWRCPPRTRPGWWPRPWSAGQAAVPRAACSARSTLLSSSSSSRRVGSTGCGSAFACPTRPAAS
jgi:thioredoxin reductase